MGVILDQLRWKSWDITKAMRRGWLGSQGWGCGGPSAGGMGVIICAAGMVEAMHERACGSGGEGFHHHPGGLGRRGVGSVQPREGEVVSGVTCL